MIHSRTVAKRSFPLPIALAVVLMLLPGLAGCDMFGTCGPFSSTKATVRMLGKTDLPIGTKVTLQGLPIGKVQKLETSEAGELHLLLCIDNDQAKYLNKATLFYVDKTDAGLSLACVPGAPKEAPVAKEMLFLGFPDYSDLLSWKTKNYLKQGMQNFLDAIDKALQ